MSETATLDAPATETTTKPVWSRARQGICVSVFPNEKDGRTWYSVNSRKRYKDADDNWQTSTSYTYNDTLVKQQLEREALAFIDETEANTE